MSEAGGDSLEPRAAPWSRRPGVWLLALLPLHGLLLAAAPAEGVEAAYGRVVFPLIARAHAALDATPASPAVALGLALLASVLLAGRRAARTSPRPARAFALAAAWRALVVAAALAHAFGPSWGLNYRRPPLAARLGLPAEVDRDAFVRTADRVVRATNAARVPWGEPDLGALERAVDEAVQRTLRDLGLAEAAVPGRRTRLLPPRVMTIGGWAGVTLPWTTEAMIDPAIDRRSVPHCIAHEKAHQAGFAREADANLIAWLSLVRAHDPRLRYSTLFFVSSLFSDHATVPLEPDVLSDAQDAAQTWAAMKVEAVADASEKVYDTYLRANEVQAGIADYDRVAELIHAWLTTHPDTLP